jgi:ABC-2 type transport system ATP-binding protein
VDDEIVIQVENVYKDFVLPHERVGSVKGVFTGMFSHATSKKEVQHALKDISFEIKKGEFFGIVGRNGSGKSTLLKILAGIYQPTKGKTRTSGKLVPFIELGVGFNPELTGRDNVYLNGAMLGFSKKEVAAMYDDIVSFAELGRFMDQKLKNYSSGMQVRLAFSMATRAEADILLIDEVLAVGDADFQRKCFEYFRQLKKNKRTVVFVSHDMEAVREYCDRAVLIDNNELKMEGTSAVIAEEYIKLFNTSGSIKTKANSAESQERWGNGAAKYSNVAIKKVDDNSVIITTKAKAVESLENPIFGILISDGQGRAVCGTNTKIVRHKTGTLQANESTEISWVVPNVFSSGTYSIDAAITYSDGITQADWWHSAASFSIVNKESTPHIVSPKIELLNS